MIPGMADLMRAVHAAEQRPQARLTNGYGHGSSAAEVRAMWERNMVLMYGHVPTPEQQRTAYLDVLRDAGAI